jgi:hypothetical protein
MDEQGFSDAVERLNRVNEAVVKLDPAIRAAAFNVLAPYVGESRKVVPTGEAMAPTTSDIEGLASEVLMEAAKDAQRDVQLILNQVRSATAAKRRVRELVCKVAADIAANTFAPGQHDDLIFTSDGLGSEDAYHQAELPLPDPSCAGGLLTVVTDLHAGPISNVQQLRLVRESLQAKLDSMSEMGEMESLRLQMAMDRLSKLMTTLSNVLKKISDTNNAITQNIK